MVAAQDVSYYDTLSLSRDATFDQVKRSYRSLSQSFHPDKFSSDSAELQISAKEHFQEIAVAFSVLSDPQKRLIYDEFGVTGLSQFYGLVTATGDVQSALDALHLDKRRRKLALFEATLKSITKVGCCLDVSEAMPQISRISLQHSINSKVADWLLASFTASLVSEYGTGSGTIHGESIATISENSTVSCAFSVGDAERNAALHVTRRISPTAFYRVGVVAPFKGSLFFPSLQSSLVGQLWKEVSGSATLVTGFQRALVLAIATNRKESPSSHSVQLQIYEDLSTSGDLKLSYLWQENVFLKSRLFASHIGSFASVGMARRVPRSNLWAGVAIESGQLHGVVLKLSVYRKDDFYVSLPLYLSHEFNFWMTIVASVVPTAFGWLLRSFFQGPITRWLTESTSKQEAIELALSREQSRNRVDRLSSLIATVAKRKVSAQKERPNGLIILEATFGTEANRISVTEHLNAYIDLAANSVFLSNQPIASIFGWYQTADDKDQPFTRVTFSFGNLAAETKIFSDSEKICIP